MQGKLQNDLIKADWRTRLLSGIMLLMLAALFFSRALLSVSMIFFVVVSFLHRDIKGHFKCFFSSPILRGMSLLFLLPLVSGLWSEDKQQWLETMQVKLPLLFLPLAFAGPLHLSEKQWRLLAAFFTLAVLAGTGWSLYHYMENAAVVNESYLRAKSLVTPLENDHVRFSWMLAVAALLSGFMCYRSKNKTTRWLWGISAVWLIVFLHLLAARTGLVAFYTCLLQLCAWILLKEIRKSYAILVLFLIIALPLAAYFTVPTFQNRVKYFKYEMAWFKKANYLAGATDAVRVISMKAGWNVMKDNPVAGTGFGDVIAETKKWYTSAYPEMKEEDKIWPASEWLVYGAGCGVPGFILFSIAMCIPFFVRVKNKLPWYMLNSIAAFSFVADIGLEVQFGVFLYSFIILWWWKWLNQGNA